MGSVVSLKAALTHVLLDRKFEPAELTVMSPVGLSGLREQLEPLLWDRLAERMRWVEFVRDRRRTPGGYTLPGVGGDPRLLSGVGIGLEREQFIPARVRRDFGYPDDLTPNPQTSPGYGGYPSGRALQGDALK